MKKFVTMLTILLTIVAFVSCDGSGKEPTHGGGADSTSIQYQSEADKAKQAELANTTWKGTDSQGNEYSRTFTADTMESTGPAGSGSSGKVKYFIADMKGYLKIDPDSAFPEFTLPYDKKTDQILGLTSDKHDGIYGTWKDSTGKSIFIFDKSGKGILEAIDENGGIYVYNFFSFTYDGNASIKIKIEEAFQLSFMIEKDSLIISPNGEFINLNKVN